MKKTLWILLPALVMTLAACGVEETPEPTEAPLVEVQVPYEEQTAAMPYSDTELVFQSVWQQSEPQSQVLVQAAELFEQQTGAAVTILWPGEEAQETDIVQLRAAELGTADYALDLTEMAEQAGYAEKSHEVLRTQITQQLGYLGVVAQTPYLGGIYYNAEVFAQCGIGQTPRTWEEFLTVCEVLREKGWQPLTLDQEDAIHAMELHLRRTIGTEEIIRLMDKGAHWYDDQPATAALEQVMLFVQAGNVAFGTPAEYPSGQNKMALSNSAMMVGTNADCADVEEATLTDLNWAVFPYPGSTGSGTWMTADVLVIHRDCQNAQAAFDFLMLLVTGEFDQLRADISCGIPADPAGASPIAGAMEALTDVQPELLTAFGSKQQDAAVKLWSAWYEEASRYAIALERTK